MKMLAVLFVLASAVFANAQIKNSTLEARHQQLIIEAVAAQCFNTRELTEVQTMKEEYQIDQGIVDITFTTILNYTSRVDNGLFDAYQAEVVSKYHTQYDHSARQWGAYSVESVKCFPR